jgi:hypothetical protein
MADVEFQRSLREDTQFHGSKLGAILQIGLEATMDYTVTILLIIVF